MYRPRLLLPVALLLVLSGCEWGDGMGLMHQEPHPLVGAWRTVSMEVYLDADEPGGGPRAISVSEDMWEETFGIQPAMTRFSDDGYYATVYLDSEGDVLRRMAGHWVADDDRVTLVQVEPEPDRQTYRFTMQGSLQARFQTRLDWNSDGNSNDLYIGVQRRLRDSEHDVSVWETH